MLRKIRQRIQSEESGFTLIELLVVILIIGILAAIAIPAFLGQREKAQDSEAKSAVRTAASAIEAYSTDSGGDYTGADAPKLKAIEPSLNDARTFTVVSAGTAAEGYELSVESKTGRKFNIKKAGGRTTRSCSANGGGCNNLTW